MYKFEEGARPLSSFDISNARITLQDSRLTPGSMQLCITLIEVHLNNDMDRYFALG